MRRGWGRGWRDWSSRKLRRNAKRDPKTTAPKPVDKIAFQLVDRPAAMRLKLTYVMKGDRDTYYKRRDAVFNVGEGGGV
jgi:hypothetical protein